MSHFQLHCKSKSDTIYNFVVGCCQWTLQNMISSKLRKALEVKLNLNCNCEVDTIPLFSEKSMK